MSEPDKSGFNFNFMSISFPISIVFLMGTIMYFDAYQNSLPNFYVYLWILLPIIACLMLFITNIINQYISCRKVDQLKALMGGLPVIVTTLIGVAIASISYCRVPIASVFVPLILGDSVDVVKGNGNTNMNSIKNSNSKKCCLPKISLEGVESAYPIITGISYGFYIMFSILFGAVFGNSLSTIC
jgi:hypothetical protein